MAPQMHECPSCGQPTPDGYFCIRCGGPQDRTLRRSRDRRQFAGAPAENRWTPWLVSTLFPQLPRHSERHFHIALAGGAATVIALGAFRLFPVALISAALLMPLLTVLYFYDVDVYERNPAWATAWTLGWGAATGVLVGVLATAVAPTGPALINRGSTAHVVTGGLLLPALGVLVMLAGPVVLLRYPRFNEVLDGTAFGAASAATFAAGEAVVVGVGVLSGGLRPAGAVVPWIERLLAIAIATPVLSMSAIGAACAALWLRYRSPVADRRALGVLGLPPVAVALSAALVVAGAIGETFLPAGGWLAWLLALDLIALVLLRRGLHVGLLEESAEKQIGPPIRCANCGAMTDTHTFCSNCGVALKALPKTRTSAAPEAAGALEPDHPFAFEGRLSAQLGGRRSGYRRLLVYATLMAVTVGVAFTVGAVAAPTARQPACRRGVQCGSPPIVAHTAFAFPGYTPWQSSGLGFSLRYASRDWSISAQNADGVVLAAGDGFSELAIRGAPASQATPAALMQQQMSSLQSQLLGFSSDPNPSDALLGTNVGFVRGPGGVYTATIATPQGPQAPASIAILAAGDATTTIAVTVVAPGNNARDKAAVYQQADDIVDSIQWPST